MTLSEMAPYLANLLHYKWKYAAMTHLGEWIVCTCKPSFMEGGNYWKPVPPEEDWQFLNLLDDLFNVSLFDETPWKESVICLDDYRERTFPVKKHKKTGRYHALEV